jgi:thiamine transporter ThiT
MRPGTTGGETKQGSLAAPVAALVGFLTASVCCLPAGYFLAAAGLLGGAAFLDAARPYLMGLSLAALVVGFARTYRRGSCKADRSPLAVALLWGSTILIILLFVFAHQISGFLADRIPVGAQ